MHEDFEKLLEEVAKRQAKDSDEFWGFAVRDGVTFPGIEVFWGNRIAQLDPKRVEHNRKLDKLHDFADHTIRSLRSKPMIPRSVNIYRIQDLLREQYFALLGVVEKAKGAEAAQTLDEIVEKRFLKITGDKKVSEPSKWRLKWNKLRDLVAKELAGVKRGRPKKEVSPSE